MVLDRASTSDSAPGKVACTANVTLVALPPYSPGLNPVERGARTT